MAMYHRSTTTEIKNDIIAEIKRLVGVIRVVLTASSPSMGIDMADVNYAIHNRVQLTSVDFRQETSHARREADN